MRADQSRNHADNFRNLHNVTAVSHVLRVDEVWGASQLLTDRDEQEAFEATENAGGGNEANPFLGLGLMCLGVKRFQNADMTSEAHLFRCVCFAVLGCFWVAKHLHWDAVFGALS